MSHRFAAALVVLFCLAPAAQGDPTGKITGCQVGFSNHFKLGCWTPVRVTLEGLNGAQSPRLEVIAADGEGSPATVATEIDPSIAGVLTVDTLTRVGRQKARVRVRLLDGERVLHQWVSPAGGDSWQPISSTTFLPVIVGGGAEAPPIAGAVRIKPDHLPRDWCAYEGANVLIVLTSGMPDSSDWATPERLTALRQWVEEGGRLVISGGPNSGNLLKEGGPLADLSPGDYVETARLSGGGVLEDYAESDESIDIDRTIGLAVSRIQNAEGRVELSAGRQATDMPLLVRRTVGFGQVTFTAFDLADPQLTTWKDYDRLIDRVLNRSHLQRSGAAAGSARLITSAYSDLSGAVTTKLGASFPGVSTVSMLTFVALVLGYLVLLGPVAYLLGQRVFGAMQSVWITFPIIALVVGGGAAWYAARSSGDALQINQLEIIDIDCTSGAARGSLWAQAFSPKAHSYDLACETADADEQAAEGYFTWQGLPGHGMGGMLTSANTLLTSAQRYRIAPLMDGMSRVPINSRATLALTARWTRPDQPMLQFDLTPSDSGLVEGVILNDTPLNLKDCKLAAGNWAWRLPDLPPGGSVGIDRSRSAAKLHTLLLRDYGVQLGRDNATWGSVEDLDVDALAYLIMFHDKLGADGFAQLGNLYQPYVDTSHMIRAGRPVLVARVEDSTARITSGGQEVATNSRGVFYRFVGPAIQGLNPQDLP